MDNILLNNNINEYSLYIFDLDGTLYYQKPFRIRMALYLVKYVLTHIKAVKDVFLLKLYREVRDDWEKCEVDETGRNISNDLSMEDKQYAYVAAKKKVSIERVKSAVDFFMMKAPLTLLPDYTDKILKEYIAGLRNEGKTVVIYSDYPVKDKLNALGISADGMYTSSDENIGTMKPDPTGIKVILSDYGMDPKDAVMIGDRFEKDGEAAIANKVDYIILSSSKEKRIETYKAQKIYKKEL